MRKLLVLIAGFAMTASVFAGDMVGLKTLKFDGSLEVLGQSANNETDLDDSLGDHRGNTLTRISLGASMDLTEGVKARVEAVRNPVSSGYLDPSGSFTIGSGSLYGDPSRPTSAQDALDTFVFHNAYVDLANFLGIDHIRLGRQYAGKPGDLIAYFGPVHDDALQVSSLDAISAEKTLGLVDISFLTGKLFENGSIPGTGLAAGSFDVNVTWVTGKTDKLLNNDSFKLPIELGYYLQKENDPTDAGNNIALSVMDLRAGVVALENKLTVDAELALNGGQRNDVDPFTAGNQEGKYKGTAFLLKAALNDMDKGFGVHGFYMNGSGDNSTSNDQKYFSAIQSDFRYGEILSNSNELAGGGGNLVGADPLLEGINVFNLGGNYVLPVMDRKVNLLADVYMAGANKVVSGADKGIGDELDLAVKYAHNAMVNATFGYAMFMPDTGYVSGFAPAPGAVKTDNVTKLWAKLTLNWGGK